MIFYKSFYFFAFLNFKPGGFTTKESARTPVVAEIGGSGLKMGQAATLAQSRPLHEVPACMLPRRQEESSHEDEDPAPRFPSLFSPSLGPPSVPLAAPVLASSNMAFKGS